MTRPSAEPSGSPPKPTVVSCWPPGRPRILVADCWLANGGDAAIAIALDRLLRSVVPEASILHAAYGSDLLEVSYPSLDLLPPLDALLSVDGASRLPHGWTREAAAAVVGDADVVISQGGGFFFEEYQPWTRILAHTLILERGVPLLMLAQSIGRFEAAGWRSLLGSVLRRAALITVRDPRSATNVVELGAWPTRVKLTGDLTLVLFEGPPPPPVDRGVAVVLKTEGRPSDVGRAVSPASVLRLVLERAPGEPITLFSTCQGLGPHGFEDDATAAAFAVAQLGDDDRRRVTRIGGYVTPDQAISVVREHRAVVTQRLHPGLFALASGVPAALLLGEKLGAFHGVAIGDAGCAAPNEPRSVTSAVSAALCPSAPRGHALWDMLEPLRLATAVNLDCLHATLARLGWTVAR